MFTSSGYFRGLNCPYFANGLCERAYCHFRHSKPIPEKDSVTSLSRSVSKEALENNVPAIYGGPSSNFKPSDEWEPQKAEKDPKTESEDAPPNNSEEENNAGTDGSKIGPYGKYWPAQQYEPVVGDPGKVPNVKYTPTPISALEVKKEAEKIVLTQAKGGAMLEYNPTPIVQLQQMRRKPSHRLKGKSAEGMEYDPESNFSTQDKPGEEGVKCRKRTISSDLDSIEYIPTKRNHTDIEGEFSEEEYQLEPVENLPEYVPTSMATAKYPIGNVDATLIDVRFQENGDNTKEDENKIPESRLSMNDYIKLLLNPADTCTASSSGNHHFELKKKDKGLKSNNARTNSVKSDTSSGTKKEKHSEKEGRNGTNRECRASTDSRMDGNRSERQTSKDTNSGHRREKRNSESHVSKSHGHAHKDKESKSSNGHKSSSSSKDKTSSSTNSHRSDSSKNHKHHSKNHRNNDKSRHFSSEKSGSAHSSKHDDGKDNATSNDHGKGLSQSGGFSSQGPEKTNGSVHTGQKQLIDVNLDLFGADSDVSDDNAVTVSNMVAGEDRDSDDTFRGDNLDSDIEIQYDLSDIEEDADTYEECLRIFHESGAKLKLPNVGKSSHKGMEDDDTSVKLGKKRVAHKLESNSVKKVKERPMAKLSPAQVMHNRFVQMQKRALEAVKANQSKQEPSTSGTLSKSRVSHGASLASRQKEKLTISTASKTEKREAHTPVVALLPRPTVPADFGSKIPTNVRQRYLNLIIDECLKLCKTEKEAYDRALEEEKACYSRASSKNIYLNVSVNAIKKLRVEISNKNSKKSNNTNTTTTLSHQTMLGGLKATQISYTLNRSQGAPKVQTQDFLGAELYKRLKPYVLTEQQLVDNGFPRWDSDNPGTPIIKERDVGQNSPAKAKSKGNYKICIRCGKRFEVYPNGKYAMKEECVYHWGKAWKRKIAGAIETRYTCCSSELEVKGCQVCPLHVHDSNKYMNMSGFMRTLPCSPPVDGDYGTYAMDCEMVYTFGGCELARVTVIAPDLSVIYESLVKPDKPVIDYNTRFSGIKEEDMKGVTTTLRDVQAVLLSLFTDKTILMGHSLESDLIATKLIHSTVVDTSVVFPHRLGPPYKRALKTLMAEFLQKIIQDDVGGHDSHEDAASCLHLMQLKLKEDAKRQVRRN
ncbi:RNA exonuclease 1 homolog [Liolophura sinensis]|uniref:RNA exonuclease 1 homolog n=1 Tax=Liolophura sinensis TaxID=3198878 RepID=UPI0031589366